MVAAGQDSLAADFAADSVVLAREFALESGKTSDPEPAQLPPPAKMQQV